MAFIDPYGREIASFPKKPDLDLRGVVRIRDTWSSYPSSGLTPGSVASILREADAGDILRQAQLAEEMEEKDPDLSAVLHTRKLAVQGLEWEILPFSDSAEDKDIAALCREQLEDLDLDEPTLDLLDAVFKGFSCLEIQWDIADGQAWATGLHWIPQQRFTFQQNLAAIDQPLLKIPNLLTEEEPVYGIEPPPWSLIYHRHKARSGLAQRGGLFRPCVFYYAFKNYATKDWLIFLEKYGQPTRIGKYTANSTRDGINSDIEILKTAVQHLGVDAAAVISDSTSIDLLEAKSSGASSDLYDRFIDGRINKAYEKVILGQTATTEGTPGRLGNEDAQNAVRQDIKVADAKALAKRWRGNLLWPIVGFNFGWDKNVPHFQYHYEPPEDLLITAQIDKILNKEIGLPLGKSYFYQKYSRPEPLDEEDILRPAPIVSPPVGQEQPPLPDLLLKKKVRIPVGSRRLGYAAANG